MPNPYIGWVNMQLVYVRHHLALLVEPKNANERIKNQGLVESAAWHLGRAYTYYLYELGANYQLKFPESQTTAKQLSDALLAISKHPGEASELIHLEQHGWIAELRSSTANLQQSIGVAQTANGDQLALLDLDKKEMPLTKERLSDYLNMFKELIDRQRGVMQEY